MRLELYEIIKNAAYMDELYKIADDVGPGNIDTPDIPEVADVPLEQQQRKNPFKIIKTSALSTIEIYDPKVGPPPKAIKRESVHIPKVYSRDDAGEQGFSIPS